MEFSTSKKIQKPKKSYFLGCFGYSIIEKKINKSTSNSSRKKKTKSLLCLSKIIRKHSSSAKTIPVDISDKFDNISREIHVVKTEKVETPVIAGEVTQSPVVKSKSQTNIVHDHKVVNKTKDHKTKDIIHKKNNKSLDQILDNVHDYNSSCRNEFSRSVTISSTHNLSNHLINNSTKDKHEIKKLSHSTSLPPPPKQKKPVAEIATRSKVNNNEKSSSSQSDNFDSIIGMSILMVTLLIMLFWGKACAIVCTCAWFYFLPRVRPEKNEAIVAGKNDVLDEDVDVNSEEYKKKVVLEGLLKRNHRNGVEFL